MTGRPLRLMADDLTGALDSAVAFGSPRRGVRVAWTAEAVTPDGPLAFDTGTRECADMEAVVAVARWVPIVLGRPAGALVYKKIDSLLRGPQAAEIAAVLEVGGWSRCVVAPAFPGQGRATRAGRQGLLREGVFRPFEADLAGDLRRLGHEVALRRPGEGSTFGISLFDADSDADLDAVVAGLAEADDVLFVGSAGLAAALARRFADGQGERATASQPGPLLALIGTDHAVTRGQLAAVEPHVVRVRDETGSGTVRARLDESGAAFVTVDLPAGTERAEAAARIDATFAGLVRELDPPGTLLVSGGETLRSLCVALECGALTVIGERMPGIPCSIMAGGRWDGVHIVSKSGAFGAVDLFRTFLPASVGTASGVHAA